MNAAQYVGSGVLFPIIGIFVRCSRMHHYLWFEISKALVDQGLIGNGAFPYGEPGYIRNHCMLAGCEVVDDKDFVAIWQPMFNEI